MRLLPRCRSELPRAGYGAARQGIGVNRRRSFERQHYSCKGNLKTKIAKVIGEWNVQVMGASARRICKCVICSADLGGKANDDHRRMPQSLFRLVEGH